MKSKRTDYENYLRKYRFAEKQANKIGKSMISEPLTKLQYYETKKNALENNNIPDVKVFDAKLVDQQRYNWSVKQGAAMANALRSLGKGTLELEDARTMSEEERRKKFIEPSRELAAKLKAQGFSAEEISRIVATQIWGSK